MTGFNALCMSTGALTCPPLPVSPSIVSCLPQKAPSSSRRTPRISHHKSSNPKPPIQSQVPEPPWYLSTPPAIRSCLEKTYMRNRVCPRTCPRTCSGYMGTGLCCYVINKVPGCVSCVPPVFLHPHMALTFDQIWMDDWTGRLADNTQHTYTHTHTILYCAGVMTGPPKRLQVQPAILSEGYNARG